MQVNVWSKGTETKVAYEWGFVAQERPLGGVPSKYGEFFFWGGVAETKFVMCTFLI